MNLKPKINIAIDGAAATGKSTLAKRLAKELNYKYIDSGAMYRALTYVALQQNKKKPFDSKKLIASLSNIRLKFENFEGEQHILLNDIDITKAIRDPQINALVSRVAAIKEVRQFLVNLQQQLGKDKGVVMDGRDIGTVVFPDAECKFYLSATPEIRAQRRFDEQQKTGIKSTFEKVLENVIMRDHLDASRAHSPLTKASDALEIDVSHKTIDEVFDQMLKHLQNLNC